MVNFKDKTKNPKGNENPPKGRRERSYKSETGKSVSIEPGESVEGVFQGEKTITIQDQKKREEKEVRLYQFRDPEGKRFVVLGRTMLDEAFDNMYAAEGGYEKAVGLNVKIERGQDEKLSNNRSMGTYELSVWEE